MSLPDQLNHLRSQYDQLVADVESGALDFEQAQQALDDLVEIDGAGQHWSIDVNGDFTCAATPDAPAQVTPPHRFVPAQLPPDQSGAAPWALGGAPGAPGDPGVPGVPGVPASHDGVPAGGHHVPGHDPYQPGSPYPGQPQPGGVGGGFGGQPGPVRHLDDPDSTREKLTKKLTGNPIARKLADIYANNKRLVIILAALLIVFGGLSLYQRIQHDPLDDGSAIPGSEEPSIPGMADPPPPPPSDGDTPTEDPAQGTDEEPSGDPDSPTPTVERVQQVVSAVTSGDRELAAGVIADPGSSSSIAMNTAIYAGWDTARVTVIPGPVDESDGAVLQTWTFQDADDETPYTSATVTWVSTSDGWKIASWPTTN